MRDAIWQVGNRTLTAASIAIALWWGANTPWEILTAQSLGAVVFLFLLMRGGWALPIFKVPRQVYAVVVPPDLA